MTLSELNLPISIENARQLALVFSADLAARLAELHQMFGNNSCVLMPRELQDGRFMLSADVLTEIEPGGLLHAMWHAADKAVLVATVEVVPWETALALLPPPPDDPPPEQT